MAGACWGAWRPVDLPAELGPPSLTNPVIKLPDGALLLSVETNKQYHDDSKWYQRVVALRSTDGGHSWDAPSDAGYDPSGRIYHWDQRLGLAPDGRLASFAWVYDTGTGRYCNIRRRVSSDSGRTWSRRRTSASLTKRVARPSCPTGALSCLGWTVLAAAQSAPAPRRMLAPTLTRPARWSYMGGAKGKGRRPVLLARWVI